MRWLSKMFPAPWRDRYGEEFLDQFGRDSRRLAKWVDAVRTASGLWWDVLRASSDGLAVVLAGALLITLGCDVVLGIGMDERITAELLSHWWGAPFAAGLAFSAAITTATIAAVLSDRGRRRSFVLAIAGLAGGAAVGTAVSAAVAFDLAGIGAGFGLAIAAAVLRAAVHAPLTRGDGLLVTGLVIILLLGWHWASSPVGPLALLVVAAGLLTTRVRIHTSAT